MNLSSLANEIVAHLKSITYEEFALGDQHYQENSRNKIHLLVSELTSDLPQEHQHRIKDEFFANGPIESLLNNPDLTEIIINGPDAIFYEKNGILKKHDDQFYSEFTFEKFVNRICDASQSVLNLENPFLDCTFRNFRVSIVDKSITTTHTTLNFRRHPLQSWTFTKLVQANWGSTTLLIEFENIIKERKNFLIIGSTGSGKTSVLNALLNLTQESERSLIIEDTSEIIPPNPASLKLLTCSDPNKVRPDVTQTDLVKRALRLRPDRIVMGEIRGSEAKDFLMALSTGHLGSFGTLHANDPQQALIRLEMLIQMGAPHWSLTAIRRLIFLSLDMILVVGKNQIGNRCFKGAYQLSSLEENGFLLEKKF